jgi:hypothetical protein
VDGYNGTQEKEMAQETSSTCRKKKANLFKGKQTRLVHYIWPQGNATSAFPGDDVARHTRDNVARKKSGAVYIGAKWHLSKDYYTIC